MGLFKSIGRAVGKVGKGIGSAAKAVGGAAGKVLPKAGTVLGTVGAIAGATGIPVLSQIGSAVDGLMNNLFDSKQDVNQAIADAGAAAVYDAALHDQSRVNTMVLYGGAAAFGVLTLILITRK